MFGQQVGVGGNKQICSYYLKGTCKYGAKCWNYHPPNQGGGGSGSSGGGVFGGSASVFGGKSGGQQDSKEFSDFVKQVSGEMTQWERSGQWLVSSFSPLKAHPPLVGFSDTSPEEFRIEAYTANKTNTCAAYQAKWMEVQQTFKQLREALKMSTAEAVQALRDVFYSKSPLEQQQVLKQPAGLFGKTSGGSMFGGSSGTANTGPGLLGAAPQAAQGSLFGAATPSIFGGGAAQTPATPGIFGGSAAQTATAKSLFGTQTSVLGTSGGSVFGAQPAAAAAAAPSVFGATPAVPQAATPGSLFGAAPSPASAQTPGSVFGAASTAQATPGTVPQTSIFGQPQQQRQGGLFGSQPQQAQQGGLFGSQAPQQQQQQPQQTSLFGAQPQQQTSLFGGQPQQQTSLFGGQPQQQTQQTGGLFGAQPQQQQQQQQQTQSAGLFGAQPQQQQQAGSVFGAQPQQQQQQTPSAGLFGAQPQPQQQQQQAGSVFGTQPQQQQQQSAGLFGAQPQQAGGLFGAQPLQQQQQQQQQQPGSVFGGQPQASTATATPSIFSGGGAATQPQSGATGSIFGGTTFGGIKPGLFGGGGEAAPKPGLFGKPAEPVPGLFGQGQPAATAAPSQAGHNYTPLDQLTPQDRAQFEADAFTFVPLCPPPLELCA